MTPQGEGRAIHCAAEGIGKIQHFEMDDRKMGFVSVWVGKFEDEARFQRFLYQDYRYSPSRSEFRKVCEVGRYDEDFREAVLLPAFAEQRADSFVNFSYAKSYLPSLIQEMEKVGYDGWNAVIMLYDFCFTGKTQIVELGNGECLRFVAVLPYVT